MPVKDLTNITRIFIKSLFSYGDINRIDALIKRSRILLGLSPN